MLEHKSGVIHQKVTLGNPGARALWHFFQRGTHIAGYTPKKLGCSQLVKNKKKVENSVHTSSPQFYFYAHGVWKIGRKLFNFVLWSMITVN